jgi:hypothetical protein
MVRLWTVQIVYYTPNVNGGLVLNGYDGDDMFACDGSSSAVTLNGMDGNDEFIFGQVWGNIYQPTKWLYHYYRNT